MTTRKTKGSTGSELADQAARNRIREGLDVNLVVEAAAGTGKTSELVARIMAAIRTGRAVLTGIVAVTFTDAAAGELKLRLRGAIERGRQDPSSSVEEKARLDNALSQLEEARIGTIHSYCGDLLRERPVEAGIDPLFEVAPDDVARGLFDLAFDRWFEAQLSSPGDGVARILRRRPRRDEGPKGMLKAAAWSLADRRDFPTPWRRNPEFDRKGIIDELIDEMKALAVWADAGAKDDYFTKSLAELKQFVAEATRTENLAPRDYDGLEARLLAFSRVWHSAWVGYRRGGSAIPKDELIPRRDALKQRLDRFLEMAGADLAPRLRDELWDVLEEYVRLKSRAGCLDFLDLLLRARDLVRDHPVVRAELQRRITHIFVDEFQDTDPLQAEILILLAADDPNERDWRRVRPVPGKLFIVGDPKQSIYRFRRADVSLYEDVKRQVTEAGGELVELTVSFRAVPEIQEAVNAAFAPVMGEQASSQARYVPLARFRSALDTQPAIVALPVPQPYGSYGKVVKWKIDESLPDATAAFVDWLVRSSGWTVTERERPDDRVPIQARHVCLLFRRFRHYFSDVTRPYVRALEARRLPHLLVGGSSFHTREEVEAIRNGLCAIERPGDELAVFATLRGPLFALSDAQLLAYRDRFRSLHPFRRAPEDMPEPLREVVEALAILRELSRARNRRPIADTIGGLLDATRAPAGLAIWPTGEQALANVARLMDMARRSEHNGIISFRSFVDWLGNQAERGEASDAPIIEHGADGVRLMTVHRAKGLEFPVVILADISAQEARDPQRWTDARAGICAMRLAGCVPPELRDHGDAEKELEIEEAARVLYVAATRARDLLVVSAVGDERFEGWLSTLNPAIYPHGERSRAPETTAPRGCPEFGPQSVLRTSNADTPEGSVAPGLHTPEVGAHRVVWWDPSVLELGVREEVGLRQSKLLAVDEEGLRSERGITRQREWQQTRSKIRSEGATPGIRVTTATEYVPSPFPPDSGPVQRDLFSSRAEPPAALEVTVESARSEEVSTEHGKRFGSLVHAVLSVVDLEGDGASVRALSETQGRFLGASDEEITAAAATVSRALSHPLLRRAAVAVALGQCRRETPISLRLGDDSVVEGIVDLAFVEPESESWVVVDFKTDVEIGSRIDDYRNQVAVYAEAIAKATGRKARGVLLRL
jgi:ATP-dependent exoDNAse (exonuclease V) beta subunit